MRRSGFTLIELLVVIAIIGILAGFLLPVMSMVRDQALTLRCSSGLRQIGIAGMAYANDWGGRLAPTRMRNPTVPSEYIHWQDQLAGYLDAEQTIYDPNNFRNVLRGCPAWKGSEPWTAAIGTYLANDAPWNCGYGQTSYIINPAPVWPGPGNMIVLWAPWLNEDTKVTARMNQVVGAASRPWTADSGDYWLWAPTLTWAADPDNAIRMRALQRHRGGKAMVVYFDGHVGHTVHAELMLSQVQ